MAEEDTSEVTHLFRTLLDKFLQNQNPDNKNWSDFKGKAKHISTTYNQQYNSDNTQPDFNDPEYRCAYMYVYFVQHCFTLYKVLQDFPAISDSMVSTTDLKICCIGGGPGTELVALIKFLQDKGMLLQQIQHVQCTILDLYNQWDDTCTAILNDFPNIEADVVTCTYKSCDLLSDADLDEGALQAVREADIIMMVKCFSSLYFHVRPEADVPRRGRLEKICHEMKDKSLMLYIDGSNFNNIEKCFKQYFCDPAGLIQIGEPLNRDIEIDRREYSDYPSFFEFFSNCKDKIHPMSHCEVTALTLEKKE